MKALLAALALSFASAPAAAQDARTVVTDRAALARLLRNSGITLQWISFESPARGHVVARMRGGLLHLSGSQTARTGNGRVTLDGDVLRIDARSFTFRGRIVITDAPDPGRNCVRDGTYEFRATGTRRYWRLQAIEACDGLADYVDVYF